jgi:hypothetical protein
MTTRGKLEQFWSLAHEDLMAQPAAGPGGLSSAEAKAFDQVYMRAGWQS